MSDLGGGGGGGASSASSASSASNANNANNNILENTAIYKQKLTHYAKTRKLSKKQKRNLFKETRRLGRRIKQLRRRAPAIRMLQPKILNEELVRTWKNFQGYINGFTIYYIACHGSTCMSYAQCGAPERDTTPPIYPSFILPDKTFIINLVNGEICHVNRYTERILLSNKNSFKNALLVDFPNDSTKFYNPKWEFPILSGIHRSGPGSTYPDYKCTFEVSTSRMGVFNLSILNNLNDPTLVYYPPTEEERLRPMFIKDLIQIVSERSGPGIFILGACNGPYMRDLSSIASNHYATSLIRSNELAYTTLYPTLSIAQIKNVDPSFSIIDPGSQSETSLDHPALMANLAAAHREVPSTIFSPSIYPENLNKATRLHQEFKANKNLFKTTYRKNLPPLPLPLVGKHHGIKKTVNPSKHHSNKPFQTYDI